MPSRGDRSAPQFDPKQPRELRRYFADLEFMFTRAGITDSEEKKKHACRYVDVDTSELWETLPEFSDASKMYEDFAKAIYALYPGSDEERKWSVADMDKLVGERSRIGIISLGDLGEYYRQFLAITTFLRSKTRLSEAEQSRAFVRGFPPDLWRIISQRLQLKFPDHFPDDPYPLADVHDAVRYVLHGTTSTGQPANPTTSSKSSNSTTTATTEIKSEELVTVLERITESFIKALSATAQQSSRPPRTTQALNCNFCDGLGHFGRECEIALDYIKKGFCLRNIEGRITLPSGAFIPRDIPGKCFKDRLDEWHRRNPGQVGTGQLMYNVLSQAVATDVSRVIATRETHPNLFNASAPLTSPLSKQECIASLECELLQLRNKKVDPIARPSGLNNREPNIDIVDDQQPRKRILRPEVVITRTKPPTEEPEPRPQPPPPPPVVPSPPATENAETHDHSISHPHPFGNAQDATYLPPTNRNFAAAPKPPPVKKTDPAYKTFPPVYDGKIATDVYDRAMAAQVTLTQRELLSLSPEVRAQVREATSARRTAPNKDATKTVNILAEDPELPAAIDDIADDDSTAPTATFVNSVYDTSTLPPGSLVVPDPYETYLRSLPEGAVPEQLVVAKESSALRSIFPLVDHRQHVESIIDPGSQIIAMAEAVCMDLGLIYDPTIILNMQSANGEVDKSLGLARNVPMRIGEITLYVQIHVIRSPAYDILLGRPFDILTESIVRNFANEDQTITIRDPNSGQCATVPTMPRGRPRHILKRPSFPISRN